jgi:hypothetical protein
MKGPATVGRVLALLAAAAVARPAAAQAPPLAQGAPAAAALPPSPAGGWSFLPSIALAYDSFGQRYVIAEEDTLDLLDEVSTRLATALERQGRTKLALRNTLSLGQEATRNEVLASLARTQGPLELRTEHEFRLKAYVPGSDYGLSSDYWSGTSRATALLRVAARWRLRVDDRFEWTVFDSTDRYNYDYRLNDTSAEVERQYGLLSSLRLGYTYGARAVPDSSAIDYRRHRVHADWDHDLGPHAVRLGQRLERRSYGDGAVRSPYVDYGGELGGQVGLHPRLRLRPEYQAAVLRYDRQDSVYSDTDEQSAEVLLEGDLSESAVLALGPRVEFRRTTSVIDRAYNQLGLKGSVTYALGSVLWIQFTDEIGLRKHLAGDDALITDYVFNWSTLYLTWQPRRRLAFDLFFALNPELHDDETNDTTTILLSTSLTVGWR